MMGSKRKYLEIIEENEQFEKDFDRAASLEFPLYEVFSKSLADKITRVSDVRGTSPGMLSHSLLSTTATAMGTNAGVKVSPIH